MPHLDSHLHQPTFTGPTRNLAVEAAQQPIWREEAFQIKARRVPISLNANMKTRPRARLANSSAGNRLMPGVRTPVLVRMSNQRPLEAGTGTSASEWNVSTPQAQAIGYGGYSVAPAAWGAPSNIPLPTGWRQHTKKSMLPGMGEMLPGMGAMPSQGVIAGGVVLGLVAFFFLRKKA